VTILAGLAEFERELILARTSDGQSPCQGQSREIRTANGVPAEADDSSRAKARLGSASTRPPTETPARN